MSHSAISADTVQGTSLTSATPRGENSLVQTTGVEITALPLLSTTVLTFYTVVELFTGYYYPKDPLKEFQLSALVSVSFKYLSCAVLLLFKSVVRCMTLQKKLQNIFFIVVILTFCQCVILIYLTRLLSVCQ